MATQYINYGLGGNGSGGVTSLNTLVGALTLSPGTGISITPSGGDTLTIASTSAGDVTLTAFGSSPSADGASLTGQALTLQPADATHPGGVSTTTQSFAGNKTFLDNLLANVIDAEALTDTMSIGSTNASIINIGNSGATVNIQGTTLYENVTQLQVTDPLITLNKGGGAGSAANSGFELEENSLITGYVETSGDRNSWLLKAPNTAGIATITPGASGITINQSSHDPVTLTAVGSSPNANGASLSSQALTLQPADASFPGVVSTAAQSFAGNKNFVNSLSSHNTSPAYQVDFKMDAADTFFVDGRSNPRTTTTGVLRLEHTPAITSTRPLNVDVNAAGYGDTHGMVTDYVTGAFSATTNADINMVTIDGSSATGGTVSAFFADLVNAGSLSSVNALRVSPGINPINQSTGSFANSSKSWDFNSNSSAYTDVTTGTNQIFVHNGDILYVSKAASTFSDINVTLSINANTSILPTFQYWNGAWTTFVPTDGTNGFTHSGNITFVAANLSGWTTTTVNGTSGYYIRITRTKGSLSVVPTETSIQLASGLTYYWDSTGAIYANSLTLPALTASRALTTDGSSNLAVSATTSTQLGYLSGTTGTTGTNLLVLGTSPTIASPTLSGTVNVSGLTASQAVVTDGSKNLASLQYTNSNTVSTLVQRDGSGNFSAGTITATLSGTATNATNVGITDDTTTNATVYPTWVTSNTGNLPEKVSSTKLSFNPSTGALSTTSLSLTNALTVANGGTGQSSNLTQYGVVYGSSTTAMATTSAGTTGQWLKATTSSAPSFAAFTPPTIQTFTSGASTYTTPAGVLYIKVKIVGSGGGGGGCGTGGSPGSGTNGSASTWKNSADTITYLSAGGGNGGTVGNGGGGGNGNAGGTNTTAAGPIILVNVAGAQGGWGTNTLATTGQPGGNGANSVFGGAGSGGGSGQAGGNAATNSGSGGGGGGGGNALAGGGGGAAGGYLEAIFTSPAATYKYSVANASAGGAAGTGGTAGGQSGAGLIIVEEYYQ